MKSSMSSILIKSVAGLFVVMICSWITLTVYDYFAEPEETSAQREIHIVEATYGLNCFGKPVQIGTKNTASIGNVTEFFAQLCAQKEATCRFVVDATQIGDVAPGCFKDFKVKWKCGNANKIHELYLDPEAHGKEATVSCPVR